MKKDILMNTAARGWILVVVLLLLHAPAGLAAESPTEQLQRKTADIKLLHQQLAERRQEARTILQGIETQRDELINEVRVLAKSFKLKRYDAARHHRRIYYNIALLRQLLAYIEAFESKIRFYQTGHDRLTYFRQLVEDDIRLTSTLDVYEIDALTTQISLVINKYMADAHIIRMDPQPEKMMTAAEVWNRISVPQS